MPKTMQFPFSYALLFLLVYTEFLYIFNCKFPVWLYYSTIAFIVYLLSKFFLKIQVQNYSPGVLCTCIHKSAYSYTVLNAVLIFVLYVVCDYFTVTFTVALALLPSMQDTVTV